MVVYFNVVKDREFKKRKAAKYFVPSQLTQFVNKVQIAWQINKNLIRLTQKLKPKTNLTYLCDGRECFVYHVCALLVWNGNIAHVT